MSDKTDELKIKDSEFETAGNNIKSFCNLLDSAIEKYDVCLKNVMDKGIMSGDVHEALRAYIVYVERLKGVSKNLGDNFKKMTDNYLSEIDSADRYLYEKGGSVVRDFSSDEYKKLKSLLDDPWCGVTDGIDDWLTGKFMKWFGTNDVTDSKNDIDACHKNLLDYNDATEKTIRDIFNEVKNIDSIYGQGILGAALGGVVSDFYAGNFSNACQCLDYICDAINEMANIILPQNGRFTADQIRNSLDSIFLKIDYYLSETNIVINKDTNNPTIEQIEDFVSQAWAALFFSGFLSPINTFLADIGGKDAFLMTIFNAFDITEGQILSKGEYEKYIIKDELKDILEEMAKTYNYSESDEKKIVDSCKDFIDYVKKYGDNWYEWMNTHRINKTTGEIVKATRNNAEFGPLILDGRTKEAKAFKKMLDSLGGAENILKYGNDAIDVLTSIFVDYSKNLEILESFIRNSSGDDNMSACAKEIEKLYNKELEGIFNEALDKIQEIGFDEAMSWLGEQVPPIKVVQTVDTVIETVGEVTGIGTEAKNMYNAMVYMDMYYSSESSYNSVLKKVQESIKNGTNFGEEYEQLVEDLKNCFNLTKKSAVKMFEAMAASSTGTKKSYYEYCARQAKSMTMVLDKKYTFGKPNILSYEEYISF